MVFSNQRFRTKSTFHLSGSSWYVLGYPLKMKNNLVRESSSEYPNSDGDNAFYSNPYGEYSQPFGITNGYIWARI